MVNWKLLSRFRKTKLEISNRAQTVELWLKEFGKASRLADEVSKMLSEHGCQPATGPESQRHRSSMLRRVTILNVRIGKLEADLENLPRKSVGDKDVHKWQEMLSNLRTGQKQMALALGMSISTDIAYNPEDVPGSSKENAQGVKTGRTWSDRARGLAAVLDDQHAVVSIQTEIIKEQDEVLDRLSETVLVTKQFALSLNQDLNLHIRLLDTLDLGHGEPTDSGLERIQNRVAILNKRNRADCSCICLLLWLLAIIVLVVIACWISISRHNYNYGRLLS